MKLFLVPLLLVLAGCTVPPTAPALDSPSVVRLAGDDSRVVLHVAISGVSLTRAPLRIEFTGNYPWRDAEGNLKTEADPHVLTRSDLGGIPTNDGGAALEAYLNQTWLPSQFRDADGRPTGFAWIDILSFGPTDVNWILCISDTPISRCP